VLGDRGQFEEAHACFEEALAGVDLPSIKSRGSILCWRQRRVSVAGPLG
jgi:hypothetical protein